MFDKLQPYGLLAGRILLSMIFIMSGVMKVLNWSVTEQSMANEGMVLVPLFLAGAIVVEIGGGLSVLLGLKARLGALALALFLIPVTLIFHDFWAYQGEAMMNQMQHFMKNMTIIGGLFTLAAAGAGSLSLEEWVGRTAGRRTRQERHAVLTR